MINSNTQRYLHISSIVSSKNPHPASPRSFSCVFYLCSSRFLTMADELTLDSANTDPKYGSLACFSDEKRIGKGQFSEVWRAISKVDNSVVALKKVQVSGYCVRYYFCLFILTWCL